MNNLRMTEEQLAAYQARGGLKAELRMKGKPAGGIKSGIKMSEKGKSRPQPPRRNKYGNEKVIDHDGKTVDSKKERRTRQELRARFRAGEITELAEQVWIRLGPTRHMRVDFSFIEADTGQRRYLDAKGYATDDWKTKQAWAAELGYRIETA